jgi:hypothetical protein
MVLSSGAQFAAGPPQKPRRQGAARAKGIDSKRLFALRHRGLARNTLGLDLLRMRLPGLIDDLPSLRRLVQQERASRESW